MYGYGVKKLVCIFEDAKSQIYSEKLTNSFSTIKNFLSVYLLDSKKKIFGIIVMEN